MSIARPGVENFGQVIADYGDFFAALASGKQPLQNLPSMDVAKALNPHNWHNVLEMQFEQHNLTVLPFQEILIHNGIRIPLEEYLTAIAMSHRSSNWCGRSRPGRRRTAMWQAPGWVSKS